MSIGIGGQKIITKGMGVGYKACDALITTHFSLYCRDVVVPPVKPPAGGGGPYPGKAWNKFDSAWDVFKPVDKDHYDPSKVFKTKKEIVLKMKFGEKNLERIYLVPINRAKIIIKVINVINASAKHYKFAVSSAKRVLHGIKINITNFRKKK